MDIRRHDDKVLIELTGRIIFDNLMAIQNLLHDLAQEGLGQIILKMDQVNYLDSSALGMLLHFNTDARQCGTEILVLAPPVHIQAIFTCAHLDTIFNIIPEDQVSSITSQFTAS